MKKTDALALFNNNVSRMADALGVSRYTIYRWPDDLERYQVNMVKGAKAQQIIDEQRKLDQVQQ